MIRIYEEKLKFTEIFANKYLDSNEFIIDISYLFILIYAIGNKYYLAIPLHI